MIKKGINKNCEYCKKGFYVMPYQKDKRKYCSHKCYALSKVGKPTWNIGLTKETDERVKKYGKSRRLKLDELKIISFYSQGTSIHKIAQTMKCSITPIFRILKKSKIEIRKHKISPEQREKMNLSRIGTKHSEEHKLNIKKSLIGRLPHNKGKTKENYEPLKKLSETKKRLYKEGKIKLRNKESYLSGEKHPNWQNGKSFEPYGPEFNNKFKRAIRKRDNQICIKCGIHREKLKEALSIHHINHDHKMSIPQNCCALCRRCNSEVNFNIPQWIKFFQSLLSERYGYQYSENQEIILEVKNE